MLSKVRPFAITFGPAFLISILVCSIVCGAPLLFSVGFGTFILVAGVTLIAKYYGERRNSILFASLSSLCISAAITGFSIRVAGKAFVDNVSGVMKTMAEFVIEKGSDFFSVAFLAAGLVFAILLSNESEKIRAYELKKLELEKRPNESVIQTDTEWMWYDYLWLPNYWK